MAASVPPPEPEGDQQGDGEEVDEDLEKKVHRRGSDEPDAPSSTPTSRRRSTRTHDPDAIGDRPTIEAG